MGRLNHHDAGKLVPYKDNHVLLVAKLDDVGHEEGAVDTTITTLPHPGDDVNLDIHGQVYPTEAVVEDDINQHHARGGDKIPPPPQPTPSDASDARDRTSYTTMTPPPPGE